MWRTERAVGLRLPDTDAEIVLQIERPGIETDLGRLNINQDKIESITERK